MSNYLACPDCKSTKLRKYGTKFKWLYDCLTKVRRIKVQQYQCKKCGRITIKPIEPQPRDINGHFATIKPVDSRFNASGGW